MWIEHVSQWFFLDFLREKKRKKEKKKKGKVI